MHILTKYLAKTVIVYILLVVLLLLGIQTFIEFTREFPDIGTGYYGILQVLMYVPMMLPADVYQFFPMAGLLGTIIGLGLLASNSELIVMRTATMSLVQITFAVIKAAIFLTLIMVIVGEVLAPLAQRVAIANKTVALSGGQTIVTRQGVWVRKNNNYLHFNKILTDDHIEGITRYQFNDQNKLESASFAKSGIYEKGQWYFHDVIHTNFTAAQTTVSHADVEQWGFNWNPKLLGLASIDTDQKSLPELHTYIKYRHQSGLTATNYEVIFWQRIFQPLGTLVMIMLAVPFVFGPLRSVTMGLRMMAGLMVGFGFYILNQFVGPMSVVYQVPAWLAALLPTMIFAVIGIVMLRKGN